MGAYRYLAMQCVMTVITNEYIVTCTVSNHILVYHNDKDDVSWYAASCVYVYTWYTCSYIHMNIQLIYSTYSEILTS